MNCYSILFYLPIFLLIVIGPPLPAYGDGLLYDYTAYTECLSTPEAPLYDGGIIRDQAYRNQYKLNQNVDDGLTSPAYVLYDLPGNTIYSFSSWIKIEGVDSAVIKATLSTDNATFSCMGNVIATDSCWSFIKGGFVQDSPSKFAFIYFESPEGKSINISISSASLQPFTYQQWRTNHQYAINNERKRATTVHVSNAYGERLQGAAITVEQISMDFPFGSSIAKTILGNLPYQKWFIERFSAAVFEDELKWYSTEPQPGNVNYTIPDQMLAFVRENQIIVRGHNIFWEDPSYIPSWVLNLSGSELKSAVTSRIKSLISKYRNDFVHWDVCNEVLHYDFYEQKLGPNATLEFFETTHQSDPLANLFMNEFNVVETCDDMSSTVDAYISRLKELRLGGVLMDGIGLEGHFKTPNPPLMRAVLDKLATLQLPIWLTEVDISNAFDKQTQARYLEAVMREGFSHPSVNGIMLWTALHPYGCYNMCLTDDNLQNIPTGDVVDNLLREWQTGVVKGQTDDRGSFSYDGFLGEYKITVNYINRTATSTFSLSRGVETKHINIQL